MRSQFMDWNEELDKWYNVDSYSPITRLPYEQSIRWIFMFPFIPIHLWRFWRYWTPFTPIRRRSGWKGKYHLCECHPSSTNKNLLKSLNDQWQFDKPLPNDYSRIMWVTNRSMSTIWRMKRVMKIHVLQKARKTCVGVVPLLWISEWELQCYGGDWKEYHADTNSDTMAVTRITSDLARQFSMISKEQSSIMDHGVMNSIRPVWTVRFATIAQSSSSSLADSVVWFVCPPAVDSQIATYRDWLSLSKSETVWTWYHWIVSLVARNVSGTTCRWIAASEKWTIPSFRAFIPDCSFPRIKQSTSLQSIQIKDNASMKLHCFHSLVKMSRALDNSR